MLKVGKKIMVHAYKRNGWLYRVWEFPKVVDITSEYICISLYNSQVITSDKDSDRNFKSKNLKNSFWFFFREKWFNIIATLVDDKTIMYYVNIASPYIYEEEAIKYYDFDLDIKVKNRSLDTYKILDQHEFDENKILYKYEQGVIDMALKTTEKFNSEKFRTNLLSKLNVELLTEYMKKR